MNPEKIYSEEELILLLRQQSREAFNYLYSQYSAVLYGVIRKMIYDDDIARDVLHDVFVKIWISINQYDAGKGRLYTWMINIARNASIDKLRSRGEIMKAKIQTTEDAVNKLEQGMKTELYTDSIGLRKIVANLKPEYEAIIDLAYF